MPGVGMLIGMALVVCLISSTGAGRREARRKLARYNPHMAAVLLIVWAALIIPSLI